MISLEQLADGTVTDRNFKRLVSLVIDTGGRSLGFRFGTGTVTFSSSNTSPAVQVDHGLGRTPGIVMAGPMFPTVSTYTGIVMTPSAADSTKFFVNGDCRASLNIAVVFAWVAVG